MQPSGTAPPERRAEGPHREILRLLGETALPIREIARLTGTDVRKIYQVNARAGWPRPCRRRLFAAARWPEPRRAALARLLDEPGNALADIAEVADLGPVGMRRLRALVRGTPREAVPARRGRPEDEAAAIRARLRAHVARQIAAFDAALSGTGKPVRDPARVLRDLAGLKRLLDELAAPAAGRAGEGGDGRAGRDRAAPAGAARDGAARDLPALRAEIARRYDGFVGGRPAA
jgi:hypothetical protein